MPPPRPYTREDMVHALRAAGLETGDTAFVSTGLGMLGMAEGAKSMDDVNALTLAALQEVLGPDGTILVPAYSYTLGRSRRRERTCFDPKETAAEIGPFPDFIRRHPKTERSRDPMMSIAGIGPGAKALFDDLPPTSYGPGSLFARMADVPGMKCVNIGLGPRWTAFIHYADGLTGCPFRYDKLFRGNVLGQDGQEHLKWWVYMVGILQDEAEANAHALGLKAEAAGIWTFALLGRSRVYVAPYRDYLEFALKTLPDDPWLTAVGPPLDILAAERARVGVREVAIAADATDPAAFVRAIWDLPRGTVSDAQEAVMGALESRFGAKLERYRTGTWAFDWIVPERWRCNTVAVTHEHSGRRWGADALASQLSGLSFKGEVDAETLRRHLIAEPDMPWAEEFEDRDWALCCTDATASDFPRGTYDVAIESVFSLDDMITAEIALPGATGAELLLIAYTGGRWAARDMLTGVETLLHLAQRKSALSIRLLFVPGTVGYAAWQARQGTTSVRAAIHLRDLAPGGGWVLQRSNAADPDLEAAFEAAGAAIVGAPVRFDPLASGHNPMAASALRDTATPNYVLSKGADGKPSATMGTAADRFEDADADFARTLSDGLADLIDGLAERWEKTT